MNNPKTRLRLVRQVLGIPRDKLVEVGYFTSNLFGFGISGFRLGKGDT